VKSTSNCLRQFPLAAKAASRRSTKFHAEKCLKTRHFSSGFESQQSCDMEVSVKSTSNCLRQFPLAAKAASRRSTKFHAEKCLKTRHFSSGFESQQSCGMEVSVKSTSNCLRQFPLAAKAASRRSTKFHAEKCLKTWHFSFGFESQQKLRHGG
jgi:hypothetical protein